MIGIASDLCPHGRRWGWCRTCIHERREKMSKIPRPADPNAEKLEGVSGLYQLKAWLRSLSYDDPEYYCGYELDFGMDRSQILDKIDELIKESWYS